MAETCRRAGRPYIGAAAGAAVEIQILGELIVTQDGETLSVTAPKQRTLLALLIANLGRPVSIDRTLETLYGEKLPGSPERALRFHVSKLRSILEPDAPATQRTGAIRTMTNGYQLDVEPSSIDAHRFATLANEATDLLRTDTEASASAASEAMTLWRGDPLAEFEYEEFAQPLRTELAERKISLDETHIEALLALGDNERAVALLTPLTKEHPYRENLYSLLMTALYRSGRQVDALAVYQEAREVLLEDLGVDPGPELSELEHQILTQAPGLLPTTAPGVGHNLPPSVPLVGRANDSETLDRLIGRHRLVQVTGLPGVGKSALAIDRAHELRPSFADGVLYVDAGAEAPVREIVERLGEGLASTGAAPVDDGNVLRTVAGREVLVLITDAHESPVAAGDVIGRLLADGDGASIIVTARAPIGELPGAAMTLEPIDPATDGVRLLAELLNAGGPGETEPGHTAMAMATGGIPRAIEIAAAAIRIGAAGGESSSDIEATILGASTNEIADQAIAGLPESALRLAQGLAPFPAGLGLDAIIDIVEPDAQPVAVLDDVTTLTATGVVAEDHSGYRVAGVLRDRLAASLPGSDRRGILLRAAQRCRRDQRGLVSANAADVVRQLDSIGERAAALQLVADRGPDWWQDPHRSRFADVCRVVLNEPDTPASRDLESVLFFAVHAFLDLGDEQSAMNYWTRYTAAAATLDDPSVQMHARQLRGNIDAYSGALIDARRAYTEAAAIGRRVGHPEVTWIAASRATMDVLLGDADAAERGADEVAAEAMIRRQPRGQALAAEIRGNAAFLRGDLDGALAEFRKARDIAASCGAAREEIAALRRIAESCTCASDHRGAEQALASAERLVTALGLVEPPPLTAAAAVAAADRGDEEEATRRLADLRGALQYRRPAPWIHRSLMAAAAVASAAGRDIDAGLRVAAVDDLGRRTGLRLPAPWEERIAPLRGTDDVGDLPADVVDLVS
ncbi:MAG: BTAD domain-containing putative transcriptional regulator [Actinomycetota bacterium]